MRKFALATFVIASLILSVHAFAAPVYLLGPEDSITLTVLRHPEFSGDFLVPRDGQLDLPAVGRVNVSGMTTQELADYISKHLADRIKSPEVSVDVKTQRMQRVFVLGAVKTPGVFDYKQDWRIAQCIAAAGSNLGEASDCNVKLLKASTGQQITVKLVDVFAYDPKANLPVEPGDVLNVESVRMLPVYITGQVKLPGMYRLRENGGIMEAISLAGGATDNAGLNNVVVTHLSGKTESVDILPALRQGSKGINPKLEPGDLVVVPESNKKIAVLGNVTHPGYFVLREGEQVHVSDALAMAGGTARYSNLNEVMVVGMVNGKENRQLCNLTKFLHSGDSSCNPIVETGSVVFVAKSGRTDWPSILSGLSVSTLAYNVLKR